MGWTQLSDRMPVHPRACGERNQRHCHTKAARGSSPRLRGTRRGPARGDGHGRFIPAPAGNAIVSFLLLFATAVHPRACGERDLERWLVNSASGSSPRLRGTRYKTVRNPTVARFIPAPAGNALPKRADIRVLAVHPRACGERQRPCCDSWGSCGSSPRLRGTLILSGLAAMPLRFIPAPAGNAVWCDLNAEGDAVHPRACGER